MMLSHTASVEKDESDTCVVSWIWLFRPSSEKEMQYPVFVLESNFDLSLLNMYPIGISIS